MKITTKAFYRFCWEDYKGKSYVGRMRDGRKKPGVPAGTIFLLMVLMVAWGKRHFLQMDQWARRRSVRRLLGCPERALVCSDSTMERSLSGFAVGPVRAFLGQIYQRQPIQAVQVKVGSQRLRCGAIDGSEFGHFAASGLLVLGRAVDLFVDAEPIERHGKELAASRRLLKRSVRRFGRGFVDLLVLDGLYVAQGFINECLAVGIDVAIKTGEEDLLMLQHANRLFDQCQLFTGVEHVTGCDAERRCTYEVWACGGFTHRGVSVPLTIARVQETYLKEERQERFYVVTTRPGLRALELREVGHRRWHVENNGFRALNALCHTKRVFTHDAHSFLAGLLIFLVAFDLIHLFASQVDPHWLHQEMGAVRFTLGLVCSLLAESLSAQYGDPDTS